MAETGSKHSFLQWIRNVWNVTPLQWKERVRKTLVVSVEDNFYQSYYDSTIGAILPLNDLSHSFSGKCHIPRLNVF